MIDELTHTSSYIKLSSYHVSGVSTHTNLQKMTFSVIFDYAVK